MMTEISGSRNTLLLLLAAITFALMIINSQSRPVAGQEEDQEPELQSVLQLSSRDEIVRMAGYGEQKLSTVLIIGMVGCNKVCLPPSPGHHQLSLQPISGALVGATCRTNNKDKKHTWFKAVTDKYGEFIIDLPSHLHAIQNLDKTCSVRILQLPENSPCRQSAFTRTNKGIRLSSVGNGIRTYTAGRITFMHTIPKNSETCLKGLEDEEEMSW